MDSIVVNGEIEEIVGIEKIDSFGCRISGEWIELVEIDFDSQQSSL